MDPILTAALAGAIGAVASTAPAYLLGGRKLSISIKKKSDPHIIRRLERENGWEPTERCEDPFCMECGIQIDIEIIPRERIVDGYLVPVPRVVPDDAYAHTEVDHVTENVKVYWTWTDSAGRDKIVRSMTPKKEVRSIDEN